ncbi:putative methyltransferase [Arthrobacter sp. PAMC 25486]|uniref:putative RNA methyltransferase n=1 Tax=Arthrobacter sp. PAMC 25486 TaxID=1494608 RepID=UPI000535F7D4|nr:methyltransferase domain-containing protein [Arthrobacter sp. PAMC 25486]AIY00249.1 putative methyltransferase [Arthrobacter sp. PAMC 25486]
MDTAALNSLLCPICGLEFSDSTPRSLSCGNGHSFDFARQGYLNLLTGHGTKFVPDTAAMVEARDAFLDAGHYQQLADALSEGVRELLAGRGAGPGVASDAEPALIIDAGTGTGYYLQHILAKLGQDASHNVAAVGLDISKFALRRAARRNPDAVNIVWDLWRELPLGAGVADVVLVIFAPRNSREFARILKPGGHLLVVTPLPGHLADIADEAGLLGIQEDKEAALKESFGGEFELLGSQELLVPLQLAPADIGNVALMGPAGHHMDPVQLGEKLRHLPAVTGATAAFRISMFQPRSV